MSISKLAAIMVMVTVAAESPLPVNMRTAGRYAVLSNTATTAGGYTRFYGDFGQLGVAVTTDGGHYFFGQYDVNNAKAAAAQADLQLAREDAASRPASVGTQFPVIPASGAMAGMTLIPGVYDAIGAIGNAGVLTFDAQGDADAVWIIRSVGAITTAAASDMVIIGGGSPTNVFFLIGAAATLGALSTSVGTMLTYAAVTAGAGATLGPVLSSTAAITLSGNMVCSYCRGDGSFSSASCCVQEQRVPLPPVNMGTAGRYAVLSSSATTAAGPTMVNGDFGESPGAAVTTDAFPVFNGNYDVANSAAAQAHLDAILARKDAGGRPASVGSQFPAIIASGALAGMTLIPGVYDAIGAIGLAGTLTFDAQGDPGAVWIIRSNGALTTAAASNMIMNGGCPGNVFFLLGGAATFGANSNAFGTMLVHAAVSAGVGANFGPIITKTAAVTLSGNTICSYCRGDEFSSDACCADVVDGCYVQAPEETEEPAPEETEEPTEPWEEPEETDPPCQRGDPCNFERAGAASDTLGAESTVTENDSCGAVSCGALVAIIIATVVVVFGGILYMRSRKSGHKHADTDTSEAEDAKLTNLEEV